MYNVFTPERQQDESFEAYKARRKEAQQRAKDLVKGWRPTIFVQHQPNLEKKWKENGGNGGDA